MCENKIYIYQQSEERDTYTAIQKGKKREKRDEKERERRKRRQRRKRERNYFTPQKKSHMI